MSAILERNDVGHPEIFWPWCDAVIRLGNLERRMGVYDNYGTVSHIHGRNLRHWPVAAAHELALAEDAERGLHNALRRAGGFDV